ncbi:MAG TPA: signal peptidase II [Polyangia bacterium]
MKTKLRLFLVVLLAILAFDQGTKIWVRHTLAPAPQDRAALHHSYRPGLDAWCQLSQKQVRVIDGFFDLCYSENTGVAFGLGKKVPRAVWIAVGVVALGLILLFLRQAGDDQKKLILALALVGGGAIGNVIDRAAFGFVTDFVVWRWHEHPWPTFNIADAALVAGVILMFLTMGKQPNAKTQEQDEASRKSKSKSR